MKFKHIITLAVIGVFSMSAQTALAASKNEAYTACKSHISELHNDQAQVKLKKIRKRKGNYEVKVKVSANGDRFSALCVVGRDGAIDYTNGNEVIAKN